MRCRLAALVLTSVTFPSLGFAAQATPHRFAVFAGVAAQVGDPDVGLGVRFGSALTVASRSETSLQITASYAIFPVGAQSAVLCPPSPGACELKDDLRVLQAGVTIGFVQPAGLMWTVGAGVYDVLASPQHAEYVRPGWTVGLTAPLGSTVRVEVGWPGHGPGPTLGLFPSASAFGSEQQAGRPGLITNTRVATGAASASALASSLWWWWLWWSWCGVWCRQPSCASYHQVPSSSNPPSSTSCRRRRCCSAPSCMLQQP